MEDGIRAYSHSAEAEKAKLLGLCENGKINISVSCLHKRSYISIAGETGSKREKKKKMCPYLTTIYTRFSQSTENQRVEQNETELRKWATDFMAVWRHKERYEWMEWNKIKAMLFFFTIRHSRRSHSLLHKCHTIITPDNVVPSAQSDSWNDYLQRQRPPLVTHWRTLHWMGT